jgi:hypothetical protein
MTFYSEIAKMVEAPMFGLNVDKCLLFYSTVQLWISMATMYENLCGKSVGRIELTFL